MSTLTPAGLTVATTINPNDLLLVWPVGSVGPLQSITWTNFAATMGAKLGLGMAAMANTGTSGATVPLLNGANTWSLQQTFSVAPLAPYFDADGPAGTNRFVAITSTNFNRWQFGASADAETGSNVGSNFFVARYSDAGVFIDIPLEISRATGAVTLSPAASASLGLAAGPAQGRLTLQSGFAVSTADQAGATTVYYTPYIGQFVPLWNGTTWLMTSTGGQLSQTTTDTTKSPAAVAANSNYDLFVWSDAGTIRCTRGPAWTSDTARGTGAGTSQISVTNGVWSNTFAITNGPGAGLGTYVGTIRSDASATINDTLAKRHVWNMYNRRPRAMKVAEATNGWTYTTVAFRQVNGNAANQLAMVRGLDEDEASAVAMSVFQNSGGSGIGHQIGIGLDSSTLNAPTVINPFTSSVAGANMPLHAQYRGFPGLGSHALLWLEFGPGTGTTTWGSNGQCGIAGEVWA